MFKFVATITVLFVTAHAGILSSPVAYHAPLVAAPVAHVAPVAIKAAVPVATSYQRTVQVSHGAVPVVAATPILKAPLVAAPVLHTPIYKSVLVPHGHY